MSAIKDQLFIKLREYKDNLKNVELTEDTSFDQLKFDSLDKLEMLMEIESVYGIEFPEDLQISTMGELIKTIEKLKR